MKMKTQQSQIGYRKTCFKREDHSNTDLVQEIRKILNKQPTLHLQELEKEEQSLKSVEVRK